MYETNNLKNLLNKRYLQTCTSSFMYYFQSIVLNYCPLLSEVHPLFLLFIKYSNISVVSLILGS